MDIIGRRWMAVAGILFSMLVPGSAWANSKFLNIQGRLTDTSGNPLTGTQTVTFRLYTSSSGGAAAWTESQSVALSTGLFNVALGSVTALDPLSFTQLYYLGIQVAGDANELSPRQQLGASAYAQGSLGDFNVGNNLAVSSSLTANGSIWTGGQAVIAGTMTVQGSALSIGGVSLTVAGGSVTVASPLTVSGVVSAGSLTAGSLSLTSSATASAFFGDGSHLTGLSTTAITSILAGTIIPWASSTTPIGFLECDGASVSTGTYPLLYSRINCGWGCADSAHFNVPDLRGSFIRGWNHSASTNTLMGDQDAASRSALKTGGNSGDNVGSYQVDALRSHTHTQDFLIYNFGVGGGGSGNPGSPTTSVTGAAGGNETRPKNAYVMWIIKTDDTALIGSGITVSNIAATSSITANAFFGDGSHLTGISGGSQFNTTSGSFTIRGPLLSTGSVEAMTYSSAPVMLVSTFSTVGDFNFYTDNGIRALHVGAGTTSGLRVNIGDWGGGQTGNVEIFNTSEPTIYFRRNKTSISAGQTLGGIYWRDHDTSTGGSNVKAYYKVDPRGGWSSGQTMETEHVWGMSRGGGSATDYMILTSSGLTVDKGSVTASAFFGDGSGLSGLASAEGNTYTSSKTFTSDLRVDGVITGNGSGITGLPSAEGNTYTSSKTFTSDVKIDGNLRLRGGTGSAQGTTAILLYAWTGSSTTHAASGFMLAGSYVAPANTIVNVGDQLRTFIVALATSTDQSKGAYCDFNGDDVERNYNTTANQVFQQTSWVSYEGANNMKGYALKVRANKTGASTTVNDFDEAMAWTPTAANTINCYIRSAGTGNTGADADMTLIRMEVWLEPAP